MQKCNTMQQQQNMQCLKRSSTLGRLLVPSSQHKLGTMEQIANVYDSSTESVQQGTRGQQNAPRVGDLLNLALEHINTLEI